MPNTRIRRLQEADNAAIAAVIRRVLTDYGLNRPGFAYMDTELDALYQNYPAPLAAYYVAEADGAIVGGAGFAPLLGGDRDTAELKKMYLLPEARGLGIGRSLMEQLLPEARKAGYRRIYLETMPTMREAIRLYRKFGFAPLKGPLGNTGPSGCEAWFLKELGEPTFS